MGWFLPPWDVELTRNTIFVTLFTQLKPSSTSSRGDVPDVMGREREKHKILVVGLPPGSTSADLQKLVKPYGNPLNASMAVDADGRERGFGFVQFADAVTQQAAIAALDKMALAGRTLNVRAVEDRAPADRGGTHSAAAAMPHSGAKGRPCYDFGRTGKCARGAACKWAHIAPPKDGESSRRPEWQKKRPLAGDDVPASDVLSEIPDDVCRKYQLGSCHRGAACRWKHIIWKGASGAGASSSSSGADASSTAEGVASKRAKTASTSAPLSAAAAPRPVPIGGVGQELSAMSAAELAEELHERLERREADWRAAHAEYPSDEPVPDEVKLRDVVWRSLERRLERAQKDAEAE